MRGTIVGDAPALGNVEVTPSGGAAAPIFALIAWTQRPGTPSLGTAPFGILEAEDGDIGTSWTETADGDYRGGSGLQLTTAGVGSANTSFAIDPSVVIPSEYAFGEIDVEVWARIEIASTVVAPTFVASSLIPLRYTSEYGLAGKTVVLPSSGTRFRFVRLGTVRMLVDTVEAPVWTLNIDVSWAAGSTGTLGLDYLVLVAASSRALSPSGKANGSSYPKFLSVTTERTKVIQSDLAGRVSFTSPERFPDHGLGGSLIELPPGDVSAVVKLSSLVPDDPTLDATTEQLAHSSTVHFAVTPRWHLAR